MVVAHTDFTIFTDQKVILRQVVALYNFVTKCTNVCSKNKNTVLLSKMEQIMLWGWGQVFGLGGKNYPMV